MCMLHDKCYLWWGFRSSGIKSSGVKFEQNPEACKWGMLIYLGRACKAEGTELSKLCNGSELHLFKWEIGSHSGWRRDLWKPHPSGLDQPCQDCVIYCRWSKPLEYFQQWDSIIWIIYWK